MVTLDCDGRASERGYSLIEMLVVVGLIAVITAITALVMPSALAAAKRASAASQVESALRTAREQAISQRRAMRITFAAPRTVTVSRVEQPGPAITDLTRVTLEGGFQFQQFGGQPDTPDAFGNAAAVDLDGAVNIQFTSEGTLVDQNGDEVNVSIFLGRPNEPMTASALTVFGPTALIRSWRWDGRNWAR